MFQPRDSDRYRRRHRYPLSAPHCITAQHAARHAAAPYITGHKHRPRLIQVTKFAVWRKSRKWLCARRDHVNVCTTRIGCGRISPPRYTRTQKHETCENRRRSACRLKLPVDGAALALTWSAWSLSPLFHGLATQRSSNVLAPVGFRLRTSSGTRYRVNWAGEQIDTCARNALDVVPGSDATCRPYA